MLINMTTNVNCKTAHQNLDQLGLCCNKAEFQRLLSFSEHLGIDESDHFKFSSTGHSGTSQSECGNNRSSSKVLILLYFSPTDDNLESTHSHSFLMETHWWKTLLSSVLVIYFQMEIQKEAAIHLHVQLFPSHRAEVSCNSAHFSSTSALHWLLIPGPLEHSRWWLQSWTSWGGREWRRLGRGWCPRCCCSDAALADTGLHTAPLPPQTAGRRTRRDAAALDTTWPIHTLSGPDACWDM